VPSYHLSNDMILCVLFTSAVPLKDYIVLVIDEQMWSTGEMTLAGRNRMYSKKHLSTATLLTP
jgi:hypothetical protein